MEWKMAVSIFPSLLRTLGERRKLPQRNPKQRTGHKNKLGESLASKTLLDKFRCNDDPSPFSIKYLLSALEKSNTL